MEGKVCQGKQGKLPFKVSSWHVTRILPRAQRGSSRSRRCSGGGFLSTAAVLRRAPKSPAANTELCSFGTAFQSSGAPGTGELRHTTFSSRLRLFLSASALQREPARSAGREQGTCTSEACGTTGFKTGQNKALRHHAKV